jgi:hypothetical protein
VDLAWRLVNHINDSITQKNDCGVQLSYQRTSNVGTLNTQTEHYMCIVIFCMILVVGKGLLVFYVVVRYKYVPLAL